MALKPFLVSTTGATGTFSYDMVLPEGVETATLTLGTGAPISLTGEGANTGSTSVSAGYYDLRIILTKGGMTAGAYEAVHIYPYLETKADLDLSAIAFADKVYLSGITTGIEGGVGTVTVYSDEGGQNFLPPNSNFLRLPARDCPCLRRHTSPTAASGQTCRGVL